jgi:16S rRNA (uracil1498-N3)-methyltransferase
MIQKYYGDSNLDSDTMMPQSITVVIGAEGGWTKAEESAALAQGFMAVSLGKRILAAVTAPVVALSIVSAALEVMPFQQR